MRASARSTWARKVCRNGTRGGDRVSLWQPPDRTGTRRPSCCDGREVVLSQQGIVALRREGWGIAFPSGHRKALTPRARRGFEARQWSQLDEWRGPAAGRHRTAGDGDRHPDFLHASCAETRMIGRRTASAFGDNGPKKENVCNVSTPSVFATPASSTKRPMLVPLWLTTGTFQPSVTIPRMMAAA